MTIDTNLLLLTIICSFFTFCCTCLGSAFVFFMKGKSENLMLFLMSFATGVMISASYFSLIFPALEYCEQLGFHSGLIVSSGFLFGILFILLCNGLFARKKNDEKQYLKLLRFSISLHNIPEGMCIGIAIAMCATTSATTSTFGAIALALAIGFRNVPEGASISLPMFSNGYKKSKSFFAGVISGIYEPIFTIIAFLFSSVMYKILPFFLAFAGATMIYVSIFELLSEALPKNKKITMFGTILGMLLMMILDLCL